MSELKNQVVFVTGCSTGIGRALVGELSRGGHRVFATARRLESVAELGSESVHPLALDVTSTDSIRAAVDAALAREGRIDVLINNAGINLFGPAAELSLSRVRAVFETNVLGVLAVTQAVFPHMAERRSGRIINVGSVVGLVPTPFAAAYCASKSAVHMLSEVLRMEAKPFGIDVVVVQPGGVESNIAVAGSADIERYRDASSRYAAAYSGIVKRANASQKRAMPARDFARELILQSFAVAPPRVVRLGTGSDTLPRMLEMPPDERDALLSATYELSALTGSVSDDGSASR